MRYGVLALTALLGLALPAPAKGEDDAKKLARKRDRLVALRVQYRKVKVPGQEGRAQRLAILKEAYALGIIEGVQFLVETARQERGGPILDDLLPLLAQSQEAIVAQLFEEHMARGDAHREIARRYVVARAQSRQDHRRLVELFERGDREDKFLALDALGAMGFERTLAYARRLVDDPAWTPGPDDDRTVSCATIARSLRRFEGAPAAKVLLLVRRDPRFGPRDRAALREATRLWRHRNLFHYVDIKELAGTDPAQREEAARFLGRAGVEDARQPLLRLTERPGEPPEVRAAACEALGGLRIARGALAGHLARLARDPDALVRRAAIGALARLGVRQAADALVGLVDGADDELARTALATLSRLPPDTDWRAWLEGADLPEGT